MEQELLSKLYENAMKVYLTDPKMAAVSITQAILESGFLHGGSILSNQYNNLFGIKGKGNGTPSSITLPTKEYYDGEMHMVNQAFAVNKSWSDSFQQHKELLDENRYKPVRSAPNISSTFLELRQCGYATDPNYPSELQNVYNRYVSPLFPELNK